MIIASVASARRSAYLQINHRGKHRDRGEEQRDGHVAHNVPRLHARKREAARHVVRRHQLRDHGAVVGGRHEPAVQLRPPVQQARDARALDAQEPQQLARLVARVDHGAVEPVGGLAVLRHPRARLQHRRVQVRRLGLVAQLRLQHPLHRLGRTVLQQRLGQQQRRAPAGLVAAAARVEQVAGGGALGVRPLHEGRENPAHPLHNLRGRVLRRLNLVRSHLRQVGGHPNAHRRHPTPVWSSAPRRRDRGGKRSIGTRPAGLNRVHSRLRHEGGPVPNRVAQLVAALEVPGRHDVRLRVPHLRQEHVQHRVADLVPVPGRPARQHLDSRREQRLPRHLLEERKRSLAPVDRGVELEVVAVQSQHRRVEGRHDVAALRRPPVVLERHEDVLAVGGRNVAQHPRVRVAHEHLRGHVAAVRGVLQVPRRRQLVPRLPDAVARHVEARGGRRQGVVRPRHHAQIALRGALHVGAIRAVQLQLLGAHHHLLGGVPLGRERRVVVLVVQQLDQVVGHGQRRGDVAALRRPRPVLERARHVDADVARLVPRVVEVAHHAQPVQVAHARQLPHELDVAARAVLLAAVVAVHAHARAHRRLGRVYHEGQRVDAPAAHLPRAALHARPHVGVVQQPRGVGDAAVEVVADGQARGVVVLVVSAEVAQQRLVEVLRVAFSRRAVRGDEHLVDCGLHVGLARLPGVHVVHHRRVADAREEAEHGVAHATRGPDSVRDVREASRDAARPAARQLQSPVPVRHPEQVEEGQQAAALGHQPFARPHRQRPVLLIHLVHEAVDDAARVQRLDYCQRLRRGGGSNQPVQHVVHLLEVDALAAYVLQAAQKAVGIEQQPYCACGVGNHYVRRLVVQGVVLHAPVGVEVLAGFKEDFLDFLYFVRRRAHLRHFCGRVLRDVVVDRLAEEPQRPRHAVDAPRSASVAYRAECGDRVLLQQARHQDV
ncbi:uncharacterized protein BcabD6B2_27160 [Babesia caballi]|uniref:Uncharacterized protein n=1 Tax=Babesia caballi TaxID=5871 RepID=A0AAV4LVZ9_BABCB|nr:hypothetical protein BcabD6B2_27160 [Babesia caballi]